MMNWPKSECLRYSSLLAITATFALGIGSHNVHLSRQGHKAALPVSPTEMVASSTLGSGSIPQIILNHPFGASFHRNMLASRSAATMDFRSLLASHTLDVRQGPDEQANVEIAASKVDGTVVMPGEVFSFNDIVGERSEERGFRSGLMFERGEVVTGIGGGVCVASTAIFNAAAKAGLKILERSPHSGTVSYAEPGLDSAVVYGCMDLKFKNDTGAPILIRSRMENGHLFVGLYGKARPGLSVDLVKKSFNEIPYKVIEKEDPTVPEGEVQVKVKARTGHDVTVVRLIKQDGKLVRREVLSDDHILPRDKVVLVPVKPKVSPVTATIEATMQQSKVCPLTPAKPHAAGDTDDVDVELGIPTQH